jgi:putative N6-adenine-specific DNA methylase
MSAPETFDIFLVAAPGLETLLADEAREAGFADAAPVLGGVTLNGGWDALMRANLVLRGATRVLVRIGSFRAMHLAQLDKRARKLAWGDWLRPDTPVAVEASCRKSKIYHAGAAAQRVATAIAEELGAPVVEKAAVTVMARIEDDLVTISLDASGASLHKRGYKEAVNRAPMRETMAALFLRAAGFDGNEPVYDPMCGSGTFVIEAAERALGLVPGRERRFAFEHLVGFEAGALARLKAGMAPHATALRFYGSDRDVGAMAMSRENAARAGVADITSFSELDVAEITPPDGPPGLVIANPPYGLRLGDRRDVQGLYAALGKALKSRFKGWRVAIITTEPGLAKQTMLPFLPPGKPVLHGGIRVQLFQTAALR